MKPEKIKLAESIEYQKDAIVSKELLKQPNGKIITFAFDEGQELSEHTAPFDAFVTVLEGGVTIRIDGDPSELVQGESILMPANIPHALKANGRFKMMLCMVKKAN
ncbi:cupin domain-containing protein [Rubellicoccus peritrichatus]|uniref:Cupin domain-containing protein n=1 Tax=Rubellicoccus peritrichatus TaxID=3080537 RepID=A0AAQ3QQV7_9BACT|nr:cupin domain-containing protein [Puniceicoccus sp. CR14]WOO40658.1 cupin domain-containing protein [Puniceicoccus sp. CR14]